MHERLGPSTKRKTKIAWLIALVGLLIFEGWTVLNSIPNDTLSEAVWDVAQDYPLVPFLAGVLCGHFFWQRRAPGVVVVTGTNTRVAENAEKVEVTNVGKK